MSHKIHITSLATQDIEHHVAYLKNESEKIALCFFDAMRSTFTRIARMPKMGRPFPLKNPRLAGLRKWQIKGFENYLIFYFEQSEEIQILRILHGSRDVVSVLENYE
jgi:toxin ParE1/3/4